MKSLIARAGKSSHTASISLKTTLVIISHFPDPKVPLSMTQRGISNEGITSHPPPLPLFPLILPSYIHPFAAVPLDHLSHYSVFIAASSYSLSSFYLIIVPLFLFPLFFPNFPLLFLTFSFVFHYLFRLYLPSAPLFFPLFSLFNCIFRPSPPPPPTLFSITFFFLCHHLFHTSSPYHLFFPYLSFLHIISLSSLSSVFPHFSLSSLTFLFVFHPLFRTSPPPHYLFSLPFFFAFHHTFVLLFFPSLSTLSFTFFFISLPFFVSFLLFLFLTFLLLCIFFHLFFP